MKNTYFNDLRPHILRRNSVLMIPVCALVLALTACSSDSDTDNPLPDIPDSVPQINPPQTFSGSLSQRGETSVARFIKNGIYSRSVGNSVVTALSPTASDNISTVSGQSSSTNTQEVGVDEADRIEFDGEYFYTADFPVWLPDTEIGAGVRILALESDNSLSEIVRLPVSAPSSSIHGMYLSSDSVDGANNKHLAVISGPEPVFAIDSFSNTVYAPPSSGVSFTIDVYDVSNPETLGANSADKVEIEGRLISSRRIGQSLYIVSTYLPSVDGLDSNPTDAQTQLANYQKIVATPNDNLLPTVSFNGAGQSLLDIEDCFMPEQATDADGNAQIIQVLHIDLNAVQNMQAICLSAVSNYTYTSTDALYITGEFDNNTVLHKISLNPEANASDASISYQASGSVPGIIGWSNQPQLRLSEYQNRLRIVTSDYSSFINDPLHRLFVLEQQGQTLSIVGQLPNDTYPDPIGKPREDIYAVRYVENKAYIVTFETIDPLYVIDLSNPQLPALQGELEIPGFSSYLQPFGDNLLLGVGQEINFGDIPDTGQLLPPTFPTAELKVSLFDVRDPMNPIELGSIRKPESYTPVEFDYRALSVLKIDDTTTFGMPIENWQLNDEASTAWRNSLMIIDVDESTNSPSLRERLLLTPPNTSEFYVYGGEDRSVLTTNGIYYLRGNEIWFHSGVIGDEMIGPF